MTTVTELLHTIKFVDRISLSLVAGDSVHILYLTLRITVTTAIDNNLKYLSEKMQTLNSFIDEYI